MHLFHLTYLKLYHVANVPYPWLQEVGMPADYVNKLARMFQDIKVSEDLNQNFKECHKHNKLALSGKPGSCM